ncbi:hypothetical protein DIPPA_09360 [Diplonema papillatum]|nr:hypothetical protein DIPPA_09360 [Diplonema papillatum]
MFLAKKAIRPSAKYTHDELKKLQCTLPRDCIIEQLKKSEVYSEWQDDSASKWKPVKESWSAAVPIAPNAGAAGTAPAEGHPPITSPTRRFIAAGRGRVLPVIMALAPNQDKAWCAGRGRPTLADCASPPATTPSTLPTPAPSTTADSQTSSDPLSAEGSPELTFQFDDDQLLADSDPLTNELDPCFNEHLIEQTDPDEAASSSQPGARLNPNAKAFVPGQVPMAAGPGADALLLSDLEKDLLPASPPAKPAATATTLNLNAAPWTGGTGYGAAAGKPPKSKGSPPYGGAGGAHISAAAASAVTGSPVHLGMHAMHRGPVVSGRPMRSLPHNGGYSRRPPTTTTATGIPVASYTTPFGGPAGPRGRYPVITGYCPAPFYNTPCRSFNPPPTTFG